MRENRRQSAFTLIEIMAVVLIIGLLVGIVGYNVFSRVDQARVTTARTQMKQIESALEFYRLDNARYPTTDQGLEALIERPSSGPEPQNYRPEGYLQRREALRDPWGNLYQYESPGQNNVYTFDLWTLGADGRPGGEAADADQGNWDADAAMGG